VDLIDTALIADDFGGYETEGGTLTERESSLTRLRQGLGRTLGVRDLGR
jgi:hypothetical protein